MDLIRLSPVCFEVKFSPLDIFYNLFQLQKLIFSEYL